MTSILSHVIFHITSLRDFDPFRNKVKRSKSSFKRKNMFYYINRNIMRVRSINLLEILTASKIYYDYMLLQYNITRYYYNIVEHFMETLLGPLIGGCRDVRIVIIIQACRGIFFTLGVLRIYGYNKCLLSIHYTWYTVR